MPVMVFVMTSEISWCRLLLMMIANDIHPSEILSLSFSVNKSEDKKKKLEVHFSSTESTHMLKQHEKFVRKKILFFQQNRRSLSLRLHKYGINTS